LPLGRYRDLFCEWKHGCEMQEKIIWVNQVNEFYLDGVIRATDEMVKVRIYFCPWCGKELV